MKHPKSISKVIVAIAAAALTSVTLVAYGEIPVPSGGKDAAIVKVRGRGVGTNKTEALKDAYRDAVEHAVGMYVDAEQMLKNENLVNDQILTQSNAYIEKYNLLSEETLNGGLLCVKILAHIRKIALTKRIRDVMEPQRIDMTGVAQNLHAQIVTETKRDTDSLTLIKNELDGLSPLKQLMKVSLGSTKPVIESIPDNSNLVRLWYPIDVEVDRRKYYNEFAPRMRRILDQVKVAPSRRLYLTNNSRYINMYKEAVAKKFGTVRKKRLGIMTRSDERRNFAWESSDVLMSWGLSLNEEYRGMVFLDTRIFGREYVLHGLRNSPEGPYMGDFNKEERARVTRGFKKSTHNVGLFWEIPEDCVFYIGLVDAAKGATLSGRIYKLSFECIKAIVDWQRNAVGNVAQSDEYKSATLTSYELSFADSDGEEIIGCTFALRNYDILNFGCVLLEGPKLDDTGGMRLWLISPLVGSMAKGYVKWISVDIPKDDVAKIASATIKVEE